jgi:hypothetical protein
MKTSFPASVRIFTPPSEGNPLFIIEVSCGIPIDICLLPTAFFNHLFLAGRRFWQFHSSGFVLRLNGRKSQQIKIRFNGQKAE